MTNGTIRYFDAYTGKVTKTDVRDAEHACIVTKHDAAIGAEWRSSEDPNDVRYFIGGLETREQDVVSIVE